MERARPACAAHQLPSCRLNWAFPSKSGVCVFVAGGGGA
jgi:hypothetical protein